MKKSIIVVTSTAMLFIFLSFFYNKPEIKSNEPVSLSPELTNIPIPSPIFSPSITPTQTPTPIPTSVIIPKEFKISNAPFVIQTPFANWDALHEDACEEASLLMAQLYKNKIDEPDKQTADDKIKALVGYGEELKQTKSITLAELKTLAKYVYNLDAEIFTINNSEDLKKIISQGHPIIVGAAGKILKNPYFKNGGPNYHMLLVIGYDEAGFITNDPGIKQGRDFRYTENNLLEAIHDYDVNDIKKGNKSGLYLL